MVLVTVGTQKQSFERIFDIVRNSKELKKENLVVQRGYTKCNNSKRIKSFDFIPLEEMEKYILEALEKILLKYPKICLRHINMVKSIIYLG